MMVALVRFLIAHRLLLVGLRGPRPPPAEPRPAVALAILAVPLGRLPVPFPLFCGRGAVRVTAGSGGGSERLVEALRAGTLIVRAELFATTFFAASGLFCSLGLAAALSFSR